MSTSSFLEQVIAGHRLEGHPPSKGRVSYWLCFGVAQIGWACLPSEVFATLELRALPDNPPSARHAEWAHRCFYFLHAIALYKLCIPWCSHSASVLLRGVPNIEAYMRTEHIFFTKVYLLFCLAFIESSGFWNFAKSSRTLLFLWGKSRNWTPDLALHAWWLVVTARMHLPVKAVTLRPVDTIRTC